MDADGTATTETLDSRILGLLGQALAAFDRVCLLMEQRNRGDGLAPAAFMPPAFMVPPAPAKPTFPSGGIWVPDRAFCSTCKRAIPADSPVLVATDLPGVYFCDEPCAKRWGAAPPEEGGGFPVRRPAASRAPADGFDLCSFCGKGLTGTDRIVVQLDRPRVAFCTDGCAAAWRFNEREAKTATPGFGDWTAGTILTPPPGRVELDFAAGTIVTPNVEDGAVTSIRVLAPSSFGEDLPRPGSASSFEAAKCDACDRPAHDGELVYGDDVRFMCGACRKTGLAA